MQLSIYRIFSYRPYFHYKDFVFCQIINIKPKKCFCNSLLSTVHNILNLNAFVMFVIELLKVYYIK